MVTTDKEYWRKLSRTHSVIFAVALSGTYLADAHCTVSDSDDKAFHF